MFPLRLQEVNSKINKRLKDALFTDQWSELFMDVLSPFHFILVRSSGVGCWCSLCLPGRWVTGIESWEGGTVGELAGGTACSHPGHSDCCCISPSKLFGLCHPAVFPALMLPLWCFGVTLCCPLH